LKTYDESIAVLRRGLDSAKVGHTEKVEGFKRLERFVRNVEETYRPVAHFSEVVAHEHAISASLDGRSVFDDRKRVPRVSTRALGRAPVAREKQLGLFGADGK
jgi:hypothetical protein